MKPLSRPNTAERFGHWLGGRWRAYRNRERQAISWGLEHGVPAAVAIGGLWLFRLLALGGLLYVAFWVGLLVAVFVVTVWAACQPASAAEEESEWREGPSGFGLYHGDIRIDAGNPFEDD